MFPDCAELYNNLGAHLLRWNFVLSFDDNPLTRIWIEIRIYADLFFFSVVQNSDIFVSVSYRLERADESIDYFKRALRLDTSFYPAYRNLHSAKCALVERWHYRMLNDSCRNEAYRQAIAKKISQGFDSILDIGTGTGLFWWVIDYCAFKLGTCGFER